MNFFTYLEALIADHTMVFITLFLTLSLKFLLGSLQTFKFFFYRLYRFQKMESHKNNLECLDFIGDENLKQLYLDSLKNEAFEKFGKMQFFGEKKRELFLKLYPKLTDEFSYSEIQELRKQFFIKENKLQVNPKFYNIFQDILYFAMIGSALFLVYTIISLLTSNTLFGAGLWLIPLFLIFIMIIVMKYDSIKKIKRLRVVLDSHNKLNSLQ